MALIITPQKSSESTDNTTLYSIDGTGAYNATTNPGGYGTPNWNYTDIDRIALRISRPNNTSYEEVILTNLTTPTAANYSNPSVQSTYGWTSISVGQSTTSDELDDGDYILLQIDFILNNAITPNDELEFTNGSPVVIAAFFDPSAMWGSGVTHLLCPDGEIYEVSSYDTNSVTLASDYSGVSNTSPLFYMGYGGTGHLMAYGKAESCTANALGDEFVAEITGECLDCKEKLDTKAMNQFYELFILKTNESAGDFDNFQLNVDTFNEKYCSDNSDCGCS